MNLKKIKNRLKAEKYKIKSFIYTLYMKFNGQ
jgi:hypothetical protein